MIRKELSIEVSIRDVFEHTTIEALGRHIDLQSQGVLVPAIVVQEKPDRIPLSFSQERLWFLDQLEGSVAYHMPTVLRLSGSLDVSVLEQTFHSIVDRHEVLRTMLRSADGVGYQEIIASDSWSLDHVRIAEGNSIEAVLSDYLEVPFDLSSDYKLRACIYDLGGDEYVLVCVFHHIASDGWSEDLLVSEFTALYSALILGNTPDLPLLPLQYSDYAIWQRQYVEGEVLEDQLSYWEDRLSGVSTLSLPTDYRRPSVQSHEGSSVSLELDAALSASIHKVCQKEGVTLFMFLLSAFKVLLSRYSGQED
ncbi:condensation domain-containing protein, partial [Aquimarina sp. RZ0]|uniref:condensation domain-containing protein n=1 Tax=Aquimarina sp. RZ0 TaxID=2607730 RepID=UPI00210539FC